ncbi:hypothetical protein [Qipengyuania seohaensis]|uniref:hypothetical protein n=1 Tax=Qipengyuania seohaensis TaxID=266951 RepID=UPI001E3A7809|nr:hypothetical protein [Qipengyuania seohaensis]
MRHRALTNDAAQTRVGVDELSHGVERNYVKLGGPNFDKLDIASDWAPLRPLEPQPVGEGHERGYVRVSKAIRVREFQPDAVDTGFRVPTEKAERYTDQRLYFASEACRQAVHRGCGYWVR